MPATTSEQKISCILTRNHTQNDMKGFMTIWNISILLVSKEKTTSVFYPQHFNIWSWNILRIMITVNARKFWNDFFRFFIQNVRPIRWFCYQNAIYFLLKCNTSVFLSKSIYIQMAHTVTTHSRKGSKAGLIGWMDIYMYIYCILLKKTDAILSCFLKLFCACCLTRNHCYGIN